MRKFLASLALGVLLIAGFLFAQDNPTYDTAEVEPSVFSIGDKQF